MTMLTMARPLTLVLLLCIACSGSDPAPGPGPGAATPQPDAPPPPPAPVEDPIIVRQVGLDTPDSALHDTVADVYLVSNIVGSVFERDGAGFISRISPGGKVLKLRWIDSSDEGVRLNAPKGMAIAGETLYVADIDTLRMFDRESGKPKGTIVIPGATFLNDVATSDSGQVYVSDTGIEEVGPYTQPSGKDAIYRIEDGKAVPLARGKTLGNPDGLLVDGEAVYVVNKRGDLYRVDSGRRTDAVKLPKGSLDGIVKTDDGLAISSWDARAVLIQRGDSFVPITGKIYSPAGIEYDADRGRLLVPVLTENALHIIALP